MECSCRRIKGMAVNTVSAELLQRIDELREKRDEVRKVVQQQEEEKVGLQKEMVALTKRLAEIDDSLSRKYAYSHEYDKTIQEVEGAYAKVLSLSLSFSHRHARTHTHTPEPSVLRLQSEGKRERPEKYSFDWFRTQDLIGKGYGYESTLWSSCELKT
ncbi:hypothetical protein L7F22_055076 [Adiantum nelumboides]|nr:hypothetical protein [Adiantum nelumboides]